MAEPLHVTNGDSTVAGLQQAGLGGQAIAWRDALWEGPVPAADAATLRELRAGFIDDVGWAPREETAAMLRERDEALAAALGERPVVLWFEHDLYDQLQLLQILSFVGKELVDSDLLTLIVVDAFPGRPGFRGLGELDAGELASLWPSRRPLTAADLAVARRAWACFTAPHPGALQRAAGAGGPGMPLLPAALRRLLEEFPGAGDGLSRTERQILEATRDGAATPTELFVRTQEREQAPFAGDRQTFDKVSQLAAGPHPLLTVDADAGVVALTDEGARVLAGDLDAIALRGVDRWIGGVHLRDDALWRWDARRRVLTRDRGRG